MKRTAHAVFSLAVGLLMPAAPSPATAPHHPIDPNHRPIDARASVAAALADSTRTCASGSDSARTRRPPAFDLQVGGSYETLTGDLDPWRTAYVNAAKTFSTGSMLYGTATWSDRFSREDRRYLLGVFHPFDPRWRFTLEAELSPTHHVVPRWALFGEVERSLPRGWGVQLGLRHREYTDASPTVGMLGLEKYWSAYRAGYTFSAGKLPSSDVSTTHRIQVDYYYGAESESRVSVGAAAGTEIENVLPTGILTTDVLYVYAAARHWISPSLAIVPAIGLNEREDLYTTRGISLAVLYRF